MPTNFAGIKQLNTQLTKYYSQDVYTKRSPVAFVVSYFSSQSCCGVSAFVSLRGTEPRIEWECLKLEARGLLGASAKFSVGINSLTSRSIIMPALELCVVRKSKCSRVTHHLKIRSALVHHYNSSSCCL